MRSRNSANSSTLQPQGSIYRHETDLLERLGRDPGTLTLGELLQQREAAFHEITALRNRLKQMPLIGTKSEALVAQVSSKISQVASPDSLKGTFLTARQVKDILNVSLSTVYKLSKDGLMPKQIRMGHGFARWRADEIIEWMAKFKNP